jgi:hypothetical protein
LKPGDGRWAALAGIRGEGKSLAAIDDEDWKPWKVITSTSIVVLV